MDFRLNFCGKYKSVIMLACRKPETLLILFHLLFLIGCKPPDVRRGVDTDDQFHKARDLTQEGEFTSGIEGPAVDRNGNIYAVNFGEQGTVGIVDERGNSGLYVRLPEGSIGNGIRFDRAGDMFIADYTQHNILKLYSDTKEIIVFTHHSGMNQPNDIAISGGDFLFASDPNWSDSTGMLWRISPDGAITLLEDSMGTTNGIEISMDEKNLYVNESIQRRIWVYDINDVGDISNKRLFFSFSDYGLDGMRCDSVGNLYVTRHGKGTVVVLSPDGDKVKEIELKGKNPTNIAFGGTDGRTCFVTVADRGCIETFRVRYPGRSFLMNRR